MTATIVSVRVGRAATYDRPEWDHAPERTWRTAYRKAEVPGRVRAERLGLEGDEQFDREAHGGVHMALLAYGAAHYVRWREELALPGFGPGALGENLVIDGLDETSVCIGDRWAVGREVVVEVSQPRGPCSNISRIWNRADLLQRVNESGRTGWYLRVSQPGTLGAGDEVTLLDRPHRALTVAAVLRLRQYPREDLATVAALAACEALSPEWRARFAKLEAQARG